MQYHCLITFFPHLKPYLSLTYLPTHHLRKIYLISWNKLSLALFLIHVLGQIGLGLCQSHPHMLLHGFQSLHLSARAYISFPMNFKLPYNGGLASILYLVMMVCPFCASKSLDTLGHHCVTCRCGGDVTMP